MSQPYLTFVLYGALASWGDVAVGQERASNTQPSRSALLGLLGAALGLNRDDPRQQALSVNFGLAVCVEATGNPMRDFHTAQVPSASTLKGRSVHTRREEVRAGALNTILSSREYQCDALYRVIFWSRDDNTWTLESLKAALLAPKYVLYLGRKSCPVSIPLNPQIINAEDISECFSLFGDESIEFLSGTLPLDSVREYSWDADAVPGALAAQMTVRRHDQSIDRTRWHFNERLVHQARVARNFSAKEG